MLHLDELEPPTPHLPEHRFAALAQLAASTALHTIVFVIVVSLATTSPSVDAQASQTTDQKDLDVTHIVFLAPERLQLSGGGGGGGNQQVEPIRRAQGVGSSTMTLRVRTPSAAEIPLTTSSPIPTNAVPSLPSIVLDAMPMASGDIDEIGFPDSGVLSGMSTGPGSGGGVGTGRGSGIGSGTGSGVGPGSGGGIGGGVYRAGGAVTAPRVITQVTPAYTNDALLRAIQGTVVLELVVTAEGRPSRIRVVRSLDVQGLDQQAVAAVAQWRFEPGRLAGVPVDVMAMVVLDFRIR